MLEEHLQKYPYYPLTFGVSPIQPLKRLSHYLENQVVLYTKREDMNSALGLGGSTLRKMEYIVPEILEQGYDTLISIGGVQSNQTRQIAAIAAHLGLRCILVQHPSWVATTEPLYEEVGNIQLSRLMGADIRIGHTQQGNIQPRLKDIATEVIAQGGKPYIIPAGCAKLSLGAFGFVKLALEIQQQEQALGFQFDHIVLCTSTGTTQAGLMVGFSPTHRAQQIIGIDASLKPEHTRQQILNIAHKTTKHLQADIPISLSDIWLETGYGGAAYGIPNQETIDAIHLCATQEALLVDPIYEGKALCGLIDMIQTKRFKPGSRILYLHLGGAPTLSAYASFL